MRAAIVVSERIITCILVIDLSFAFVSMKFSTDFSWRYRLAVDRRINSDGKIGLYHGLFLGEPAVCSTAVSGAFRKAATRHTRAELGLAKLREFGAAALQTGRSPAGASFGRSGLSGKQCGQGSNCECKCAFHACDPFCVDGGRLTM